MTGDTDASALGEVIRGTTWIALGSAAFNLGGLIFWMVVGRLAGAIDIGYATTAASLAGAIAALTNPGLSIAVLREMPLKGGRALSSALTLSLIVGAVSALLALPFSRTYPNFDPYIPIVMSMVLIGMISAASTSALVASQLYEYVFATSVTAVIARLVVGVLTLLWGLGGYGVVLAYLAAQLANLSLSTTIVATRIRVVRPTIRDSLELLKTGLSNYPLMLSDSLLLYAGTLSVALLSQVPEEAGAFYMSLMILLVTASVPRIMAGVGLPVSVRGGDVLDHAFRIGGAVAVPLAVFMWSAPSLVIGLISRELAELQVLTYLTLALVPQVALIVAASKLNAEGKLRELLGMGVIRLVTLIAAAVLLAPTLGSAGTALAYLASTLTPIPVTLHYLDLSVMSRLLVAQVAALPVAYITALLAGQLPAAIIASTISLALIVALRVTEPGEIIGIAKMSVDSLLKSLKP